MTEPWQRRRSRKAQDGHLLLSVETGEPCRSAAADLSLPLTPRYPLRDGLSHAALPSSLRLRGEVGVCALFAQIPGEGASPARLGQWKGPSPRPSPGKRGKAEEGSATCDSSARLGAGRASRMQARRGGSGGSAYSACCACAARVPADTCSGCALAGLPNRPTEPISAAANRRTSMRYWSLRTGCSRPTGCHGAACSGSSPRPARWPWWRKRMERSWASPSCCFVPTAGSRGSIPSQSPRSTQAAGSRRPSSRGQRKSRGGANADP